MTRKELNKILDEANLFPQHVTMKKDGTIEFRRAYFYRNGSSEGFAAALAKRLPMLTLIGDDDEWRAWPKTSYFVAKFKAP